MTASKRLPIRVRQVHSGDGITRSTPSVYCRHRDSSHSLAACAGCADYDGISLHPDGGQSFLRCHRPDERPNAEPTVADAMTRNVICITADVGSDAVAALLVEHGIGLVPVVDDDGQPIGVVSKTDLLLRSGAAGDIMVPVAFTLEETAPLSFGAALMITEGVHQLPIVSSSGDVVGVLSSLDVLRWLAPT